MQGGTSTGRGVRDNCAVTQALPELLGTARVDSCDVTEKWSTSFRGLASYTVPKIDVLVSASMRSLEATPGGGVATNGLSLAAQLRRAEHRHRAVARPAAGQRARRPARPR